MANLLKPTYDDLWDSAIREALAHETKLRASELTPGMIVRQQNGDVWVVVKLSNVWAGGYTVELKNRKTPTIGTELYFVPNKVNDDPTWTWEGRI